MARYLVWRLILAVGHPPNGRSRCRTRLVPVTSRTHWPTMTHTARTAGTWQLPVLLLGVALLLAACGPTTQVGQAKAKTSTAQTTTEAVAVETTPEAPPTTAAPAAGPADFTLSVKILTQTCFGSAGCNLTYRVQVDHGPPAGTYEVSYEVIVPNDTNSPYQDTIQVTDGQYEQPFEGMASPGRRVKSAAKIRVRVTAVEAQ